MPRAHPDFRTTALQYATRQAVRDPASQALWPEVVYPLIERRGGNGGSGRGPRRSGTPWWAGCSAWATPESSSTACSPGPFPAQLVAQIDDSVNLMAKKPVDDDEDEADEAGGDEAERLAISAGSLDIDELAADHGARKKARSCSKTPTPCGFLQGQLNELWKEAVNVLQAQARPATQNGRPPAHSCWGRTGWWSWPRSGARPPARSPSRARPTSRSR